MITDMISLRNKSNVFEDRWHAGKILAEKLSSRKIDLIIGIPNGGIPVAEPIIHANPAIMFSLFFIKKIHLPGSTEAGMGAVIPDGQVFYNYQLIDYLHLQDRVIERQVKEAKDALSQRIAEYNISLASPKDKHVLVVDDGIASGFTMLAGATWLTQQKAKSIILGVPTGSYDSIVRLEPLVSEIVCLNIRTTYPFAVADAYTHWYDVSTEEAKTILNRLTKHKLT